MSILYEAAAGSGKTTKLIELATSSTSGRILITTFTDENTDEIRKAIVRKTRIIPDRIDVMPWFTFLLRHCVKPYLWSANFGEINIAGVNMPKGRSASRTRIGSKPHYFDKSNRIYTDKLSELAVLVDAHTHGQVVSRLASIYEAIFIDEVQDLGGYDLEILELLLRSDINVIMAGDVRQTTYKTDDLSRTL